MFFKKIKDFPIFIQEVKTEVKRVTWPSRQETVMMTIFVFVLAVIAAIYFSLVDQCIYRILKWIIG